MKERFVVTTLHCSGVHSLGLPDKERTSVAESRIEAMEQFERRREKLKICEGSKQSIVAFLEGTEPPASAVSIITSDWGRYLGFIRPVTD